MSHETVTSLKRQIKLAVLDGLSEAYVQRLRDILTKEQELLLRSRLPGSCRTVAEELADNETETEE